MMIKCENLALRRGHKLLFTAANLTIHHGDKLGLVGRNGCGKSSWFAMIRGLHEPDDGVLSIKPHCRIAYVAQETPALNTPALDYIMQGDADLIALQQAIAAAELNDDGLQLARLHEQMMVMDAYAANARAASLMHGLGFAADQLHMPVAKFSGGWRMRLNLARALMCPSDVLLLDEPTNHLDLEAVVWLEQWLQQYEGALLLISHDREVLDHCVTRVIHIEQQQVRLYTGNYTDFECARAERFASQQAAHQKQQREVAHMEDYIRRFRAKASKAKQAQSRIKALERMQLIAPAHIDSPFSFSFSSPDFMPTPLLQLQRADIGYGDAPLLKQQSFSLLPGDRIALLGPNGAGKSTLMRVLAGILAPLSGDYQQAKGLRIAYFAQHQLEQLHLELSPVQHLMLLDQDLSEKECRNILGTFDFHDDASITPIAPLSGGEKARLVLAMMVYQKPHVLLLDEPTNHLDLDMRHALTLALQTFTGSMVLISHDRHLLRTACDQLWLVASPLATPFDGDLDDYTEWCGTQRKVEQGSLTVAPEHSKKSVRKNKAAQRKITQPLRQKIQQWEKQINNDQTSLTDIEKQLADPTLYANESPEQVKNLSMQQKKLQQRIAQAEDAWLEASDALEESLGQFL
ncbi:MAG: ATP-binding cassette domain-containing protein [Mariprofundaceae bacterium]|nr:ATP-binding cassette domain-containing protein [Mariprofundaceae bacterium]